MDPSFRIWGHKLRSDSFLCLRLGWRQRDEENVKRSSRQTSSESVHKKTENHRQKWCSGRAAGSNIGSVRSEVSRA